MNHQRLRCYQLGMLIAKAMPGILMKWPKGYYYLSDQLKRAVASIVLNIAEGNSRLSQVERKRFFTISMASTSEVSSIFEIAYAYDLIDKSQSDYLQDILLQIYKILYKLN